MPSFARETIAQVRAEITPLLERHWREIAHYPDIPLDPDYARYEQAERFGTLRIYTVRDPELIGYALFFVATATHYRSSLHALQDILYVSPGRRGAFLGAQLIAYSERMLTDEGVQVVVHHVKVRHATLGHLLARAGYEAVDTIYQKRLDR